jgi:NADP-dependent 3-hydroxy acid dehydrogenase YdfG
MTDKVIAITGASSGIGEAAARLLAAGGAKLVLGARRMEKLEQIVADIEAAGGSAVAVSLDVTDPDSMNAFVNVARERYGRIDVLVNNAGIMYLAPLSDLRVDEWDRMVDVNIKGILNGVAAAWPHMMEQESGHMVIVGSIAGRQVLPLNGVYAATKYAVRALAEWLRLEGGTAIRSTLIAPGAVQTELFEKIPHPQINEGTKARLKDALPVDSIARAIVYAIEQPDGVDVNEVTVRPMVHKY